MNKQSPRIHITSVPPGEAPEWVREKWVGLYLPLALRQSRPRTLPTSGVLSAPRNILSWLFALLTARFKRTTGYVVETSVAIQILEANHPDAAMWWKLNTPRLTRPGRYFVFAQEVGHVVD